MTEDQYLTLCECCDNIIVSEDSTYERVAITWLHVIREHPVFLRQYEDIFLPELVSAAKLFKYFRLAVLDYARTIRATWQYFRSSKKKWCGDLPSGPPVDFVFVSHLFNSSQLTGEDDFYFGKVPAELISKGKSVVLVLINHNDIPLDYINHCLASSTIPRIVISNVLSPKDEYRIRKSTSIEAKRLKLAANGEISDIQRKILSKASIEATSPGTKASIRIANLVGEIINHCRAQRVVTTYEGHPWERLVYATARKSNPGISCIGYQHAALFRLQHAAKRSLGEKFDPDVILCAGSVGYRQILESGRLPQVGLGILGSARSISVSPRMASQTCLILPEGYQCESEILFLFSLLCAAACPKVTFIWRLHPAVSLQNILKKIPSNGRNMPKNIEISTESFSDDIARSTFALYRGSTAIISAGSNNIIPIYLSQPNELTIDPLFEISESRPSVESVGQFIKALQWNKWTAKSRRYCNTFYSLTNSEALLYLPQAEQVTK